jgi:hypothetical protein
MRRRSASLLLFLLCLALGLAGGLSYSWLVAPRPFASEAANSAPDQLNPTDRDLYLRLVAAAYAADGNREQAAARLAAAGPDVAAHLSALLAADLVAGRPVADLAQLATDLGLDAPAAALLAAPRPPAAATAAVANDTLTTPSPMPSAAPVVVLDHQPLCPGETTPRLVVRVVDEAGRPQTGVAVTARWADEAGNDAASTAITGFAADGDAGTADFTMQPGVVYTLELDGQIVAEELQLATCPDGRQSGWEIDLQVE